MQKEYTPSIIFSVFQTERTDAENGFATDAVSIHLSTIGINHKIVLGCYKGVCEQSFIVDDTPEIRAIILDLANQYRQESVLYLDNERIATLHYLNINTAQFIGRFIQTSRNAALQEDAWTFDPEHEQFYIVV